MKNVNTDPPSKIIQQAEEICAKYANPLKGHSADRPDLDKAIAEAVSAARAEVWEIVEKTVPEMGNFSQAFAVAEEISEKPYTSHLSRGIKDMNEHIRGLLLAARDKDKE